MGMLISKPGNKKSVPMQASSALVRLIKGFTEDGQSLSIAIERVKGECVYYVYYCSIARNLARGKTVLMIHLTLQSCSCVVEEVGDD